MSTRDAQSLINELASIPSQSLSGDDEIRNKALDLAKELTATLANPVDKAVDILLVPHVSSAIHMGVRLGLYESIAKADPDGTGVVITTAELATSLKAEELFVSRILRLLASMDYVAEIGPDEWTSTSTTHSMANPAIAAGHRFVWDIQIEAVVKAPRFLEETGWRSPYEPTDGFIQYANRTKYNTFDYMAKVRPERLQDFHLFMGHTMGTRGYWVDWYPVEEKLLAGLETCDSDAVLVDVGGGKGHDLLAFANKFSQVKGQLILQDIPVALDTIEERDPRLTYQKQDFFQPNTVKGARAYFMHHILHDWSNKYALSILQHLRDAMKPGYSKLLIHDLVLPNSGVTKYQASWDMCMMTFGSGMERSRAQWQALLKEAGLDLVGIYHGPHGEDADGIVEAMVMAKE